MEKIHFETVINAPREKVWDLMLGDATYRVWTKPFSGNSSFRGDWSEGSKIIFVGDDGKGGGEMGMVSRIAENRKPEFISIQHMGIYKDGIEDTLSDEAKKWALSFENYTFLEVEGGTKLMVDIDVEAEYKDMFGNMWPEALKILKELAEA